VEDGCAFEDDAAQHLIEVTMKAENDLPTALTFLMAGLGLGAFLTLLVAPYPKGRLNLTEWATAVGNAPHS
jgi:hypothetical protein